MATTTNEEFPCSLTLTIPFPTARLARIAQQAISVDTELSPLVRRTFSLSSSSSSSASTSSSDYTTTISTTTSASENTSNETEEKYLVVHYKATTDRMLRVSVNGFMESLALVLDVMANLDGDSLQKHLKAGPESFPAPVPAAVALTQS